MAATGTYAPDSALLVQMMSGSRPQCSKANMRPVRPHPVATSSPASSCPNPSRNSSLPMADSAPRVRPCQPPVKCVMRSRPVAARANSMAASTDSVPELQKYTASRWGEFAERWPRPAAPRAGRNPSAPCWAGPCRGHREWHPPPRGCCVPRRPRRSLRACPDTACRRGPKGTHPPRGRTRGQTRWCEIPQPRSG